MALVACISEGAMSAGMSPAVVAQLVNCWGGTPEAESDAWIPGALIDALKVDQPPLEFEGGERESLGTSNFGIFRGMKDSLSTHIALPRVSALKY